MLKRILRIALILALLFLLLSALLPPLFRARTCSVPPILPMETAEQAERVRIIDDNTDALIWRLRLIEAAQSEIALSTFQFYDDDGGRDIMAALYAAAERGVRVRILADGVSGVLNLRGSRNFRQLAQNPNVEVRLYNPVNLLTPWTVNYRLHDKYLIADNAMYILGGRNVSSLFLGDYPAKQNEDRDVLVLGGGASMRQLSGYFAEIWNSPCSKPRKFTGRAASTLGAHYAALRQNYPEAFTPVDWEGATTQADGVTLLSGEITASNKRPEVWAGMLSSMRGADDVTIITPYIICDSLMLSTLREVMDAGTAVHLITNAPENGANPFGCADYLTEKNAILRQNMDVAEYWGEKSLHTKTVLIDDTLSIVGSFNMDIRSAYLDTELMLVIESADINRELRAYTETMRARSVRTFPDGTKTQADGFTPPKVPKVKSIGYGILGFLIRPFRYLL